MDQTQIYATLDDWITEQAIPFSDREPASLDAAVDQVMASFDGSLELLGLGEALHGGEDILLLRNRLFQRLVQAHGYSAIAVESSFPRGRHVNDYVTGCGPASYQDVQENGFSHGFGRLEANRELVEWMRAYNADPSHPLKVRFYGFDSPTEMTGTDSPSRVLHFALDYLASVAPDRALERRERIDALLGSDADWENPAAMMDPTQSVGLSEAAAALRIETEDLITDLEIHRPEWVARSDANRFSEALQHAIVARQLLNYHAALARESADRVSALLGIRDAMMADILTYIVARERSRGKALAFAHNRHLQRGKVEWQLGPLLNVWWPAGAHLDEIFGERYAVIGSGLGVSPDNGIEPPEAGTLEALLISLPQPALFIPTYQSQGLPGAEIAALPTRSGSLKNSTYMPLGPESFSDFDWLAALQTTTYNRGGPPLP